MSSVSSGRPRSTQMDLNGRKRFREDEDESAQKRARPTVEAADGDSWARDSVLSTPTISQARVQPKYASDDELSSSMVSEPGSPQDVSMSSDDEGMASAFSQSPDDGVLPRPGLANHGNTARGRDRVATPYVQWRPGSRPSHVKSAIKQHIRQRHPQENISSDLLGPPSPIDVDEVSTPPSAAEAAGSQLSLLSVHDVDMADQLPTISIDPARPLDSHSVREEPEDKESAIDMEPIDQAQETMSVRKQRQRSGALSNGNSPIRPGPDGMGAKRGFSIGFRADCEKCRMRVPGHMNHFIC